MRRSFATPLLIMMAGCAGPAALNARLEEFRRHGASAELAGVVIAQREPGGTISAAAAGCAQFVDGGRRCRAALAPSTLLRVASISKLATTLATMRLVERGALDLDRDVSDYLGFRLRNPAFPDHAITLRQLLSHSASLIDGDIYWVAYPQTLQQFLQDGSHFDAARAPGSCFRYANLNFGIIGTVLERASGLRFDQLMQREVFAPLQIEAGFNWSGLTQIDPRRVGAIWKKAGDARNGAWQAQLDDFAGGAPRVQVRTLVAGSEALAAPPASYEPGSNGTLFSPQGGMRISVQGLLALGAQLLPAALGPPGPRLLGDASVQQLFAAAEPPAQRPDCDSTAQPPSRRYGLGVELLSVAPGGATWVGHFGDAYGLKAAVLAERRSGMVRAYIINGSAQPLPPAPAPWVEMDQAEAALLSRWPL